ncbi:MAG: hypothetical protein ABW021_07590 [Acidimicrobiia bacterium]|jgi:hypothetical protein
MSHREPEPPDIAGGELAAGIGVMFAATLMIVGGILQVFQGISAIANDEFFVTLPNYVVTLDVSTWGWIHLVFGALVILAGFSLFSGSRVAAIFALVLAVLSAIANFGFIPYYPVWALFIIAVDVFIIWAIARSGVLKT